MEEQPPKYNKKWYAFYDYFLSNWMIEWLNGFIFILPPSSSFCEDIFLENDEYGYL